MKTAPRILALLALLILPSVAEAQGDWWRMGDSPKSTSAKSNATEDKEARKRQEKQEKWQKVADQEARRHRERFTQEYDRFKDVTSVHSGWSTLAPTDGRSYSGSTQIIVGYEHAGQMRTAAATHGYILFHSNTSDWRYLRDTGVIFIADGTRLNFGEARRSGRVNSGAGRYGSVSVTEYLAVVATREQLEVLANARNVEVQLSVYEFAFGPGQVTIFQELLRRMGE